MQIIVSMRTLQVADQKFGVVCAKIRFIRPNGGEGGQMKAMGNGQCANVPMRQFKNEKTSPRRMMRIGTC